MKIVVTGGLGYLGTKLVGALAATDARIKVVDSDLYANGYAPPPRVDVVAGDILDPVVVQKSLQGADVLVHLAAIVGDPACDLDKNLAIKVNYLATRNLAMAAKKVEARFIFFSTCSVYGAMPDQELTELSQVAPFSIYAIGKLAAEEAIQRIMDDSIILRLGTAHGLSSRMRFDLVVNRFVAQAIQEGEVTVFGGSQYRPFIHVDDIVSSCILAVRSNESGVFNIGGQNHRIIDVANSISKAIGCEVNVLEEIKDPRNYIVTSEKARRLLGVEFRKDISDTIIEIKEAYADGKITNYRESKYSNEELLRAQIAGSPA